MHQLSDCAAGHAERAACQLSEKPRGSFLLPSLHHLLHGLRQLEEIWYFCQLISWSSNRFQVAVLEFQQSEWVGWLGERRLSPSPGAVHVSVSAKEVLSSQTTMMFCAPDALDF